MSEPTLRGAPGVAAPPRPAVVAESPGRVAGAVRATGPVTRRSVLLGFALVPVNSLWIVHTELVRYAGHPTTTSLYFNVVFCLFVLVGLNAILRLYRPGWALRQSE